MEKIMALLGIPASNANWMAEAAFEEWDGIDTPEDCAEDEASYWGD